jgi:hypothetical protein
LLETNIQEEWRFIFCVLPKFTVENEHQRMAFAEWDQNNGVLLNNVWFSDEAHLNFDIEVNKQNVRF